MLNSAGMDAQFERSCCAISRGILNYLLYNGEDFTGKGHSYHADTPDDLYERMRISMDLCEELTAELDHKVAIFSFPMRYIPLSDLKRGFVGARWNAKYLRALQRMLIPTQGKGVSSHSFFEADFGKSSEEFVMYLAMPEEHLGWRGHFAKRKNESDAEMAERKKTWDENQQYLGEWKRRFLALGDDKDKFISYIGNNSYSVERYLEIKESELKKLYLHYFTIPTLLKSFLLENETEKNTIVEYITQEFPLMYERMIRYVAEGKLPYSMLEGAFRTFGATFAQSVLQHIDYTGTEEPFVVNSLIKVQKKARMSIFKFEYIQGYFLYKRVGALDRKSTNAIVDAIKNLDEGKTRSILADKFEKFKAKMIAQATENEVGAAYITEQIEQQLDVFCKQMSLFEDLQ